MLSRLWHVIICILTIILNLGCLQASVSVPRNERLSYMHISAPHQLFSVIYTHCQGAQFSFEECHVTSQSLLVPKHKQIPVRKSWSATAGIVIFFVITLKDANKGAKLICCSASILINNRILACAVSAARCPCALRR